LNRDHIKTVKFGGSSLSDANQFKKVADIILSDKNRRYVVPSAPGKRYKDDVKVTDMLYKCNALAERGESIDVYFDGIKKRYNEIINGLGLKDFSLEEDFETVKNNIKNNVIIIYHIDIKYKKEHLMKYDLVIIGGGTSGVACSYIASKLGLKTLLVEKTDVLGGAITQGLVIPVMKLNSNNINVDFYNELINYSTKYNAQITYSDGNSGWFNPELLKIVLVYLKP